VNRLLKYLLRGFVAKDKAVRFRCVGLVAEMVSYLGEIECVPPPAFPYMQRLTETQ
jgi:hypothetical protein